MQHELNAMLMPPGTPAGLWILESLLAAAAVVDWRTSRLPNALTLGGLAFALAMSASPWGIGLADSLMGAGSAFALLLPLWFLRVTGAGDVKLMTMAGAFVGVPGVFFALLFTAVAGGFLAVGIGLTGGNLRRMAANARDLLQVVALAAVHRHLPGAEAGAGAVASAGKLPYGVCAFIGTSAWLAWQALQG